MFQTSIQEFWKLAGVVVSFSFHLEMPCDHRPGIGLQGDMNLVDQAFIVSFKVLCDGLD